MNFLVKPFNTLSTEQIYDMYALRCQVFVVEQQCAYQDVDEKDLQALHVLHYHDSELLAYARILPPGLTYKEAAIGRVVVKQTARHQKKGEALMKYCMSTCLEHFDCKSIRISAQTYLTVFYQSLGFVETGKQYLEDNIPHTEMLYKI